MHVIVAREILAQDLWSYGEDDLAIRALDLSDLELGRVGVVAGRLLADESIVGTGRARCACRHPRRDRSRNQRDRSPVLRALRRTRDARGRFQVVPIASFEPLASIEWLLSQDQRDAAVAHAQLVLGDDRLRRRYMRIRKEMETGETKLIPYAGEAEGLAYAALAYGLHY
jgi:hypothetical protein